MKSVGLRELKNRLSEYIRDVRRGETVLVTDRGDPVAELGPPRPAGEGVPPGLRALASRGLATLGQPNSPQPYRAMRRALETGRAAALLEAERGSR